MPGHEFYLWQVPSFTVRIALDLVKKINEWVADPRNGAGRELGGVLLGRTIAPEVIEIDGFEFLHSEHHRGTIFALGIRERKRVLRQIGSLSRSSRTRPMGFFRTHLRPGLFLDQDDFALMTEAFSDPSQVALLIRPEIAGPATAGIFLWDDGDIDRRQTPRAFPFDQAVLRSQGPIGSTEPESQPNGQRISRPLSAVPAWGKSLLGWSVAALAGMSIAALVVQRWHPSATSAAANRPMAMHLKQNGQMLLIDWDKKATELQRAGSAVLTIDDGGTIQKLVLNRSDLEHGRVEFWPRSGDVSVKMDLGNGYKSESAAVHSESDPVPAPVLMAKTEPPPNEPALPAVSAPLPEKPAAEVKPAPVQELKPTPSKSSAKASPRHATPRFVKMPSPTLLVASAPAAPAHALMVENAPPPSPLKPIETMSARIHDRSIAVYVTVEPKEASEFKKVVSHVPLFGHSFRAEAANFTPARPSRSLEPRVPEFLAANLAGETSVDVKVSIDKHGLVKNAAVLGGQRSQLAELAADTAESTSWEPARDGDHNVSSDVIVHYRFRPKD